MPSYIKAYGKPAYMKEEETPVLIIDSNLRAQLLPACPRASYSHVVLSCEKGVGW